MNSTSTNNISLSSTISVGASGTLDVTGLSGSTITLGSTQTLTGVGSVTGTVAGVSGAQISPGTITANNGGQGTLTVGNLTLASGNILNFGLSSDNTDGALGANASLISTGNLTLAASGTTTIQLYQPNSNSGFTTAGTYDLIKYTGTLVGTPGSAFSMGNTGSGAFSYTFSTVNAGINLNYITVTLTQLSVTAAWNVDADGNWSNSANWTGGVPQLAGSSATFGSVITAPRTVTLDANESVGTINFSNANAYTVSGANTLTLDNNASAAAINDTLGSHFISSNINLNSSTNVTVVNSGDTLTLSGNIATGTGTPTLSKAGAGTLVLSGNNTYGPASGTIGTTLSAGTLQVGSNTAISTGDLAVTGNAILQAGAAGLTLANNAIITAGDVLTVDTQANTLILSGVLSQTGTSSALTKIGAGTLILTGNNTYAGATTISNGTLQLGNATAAGSVTGTIVDNAALVSNRSNDYSLGNLISGTGTFTQAGSDNVTLSAANTFSGDTAISAGTLILANASALQNSTLNYNNQGGALSFGTLTAVTLGGLKGAQDLALTNTTPAAVALTIGNNNQNTVYTGALTGGGSILKIGNGSLTLSGANGYTGTTTASSGTLTLGGTSNLTGQIIDTTGAAIIVADSAVINSSVAPNFATAGTASSTSLTVKNTAQVTVPSLSIGNTGVQQGANNFVTVQDTAALTVSGVFNINNSNTGTTQGSNPTLNLNGGTLSVGSFASPGASTTHLSTIHFNGGVVKALADDTSPTVFFLPSITSFTGAVDTGGAQFDTNGHSITIAANLTHGTGTPDGGLTKLGSGTLTLTGTNTYTGNTNINVGTLNFNATAALGAATNSVVFGGGTLQYASGNTTDLSTRTVSINAGGGTIDTNGNNVTYSSAIGNAGAGGLTKAGAGRLQLAPNGLTSTGGLNINGGTLATSGNITAAGPVSVANGGTIAVGTTNTNASLTTSDQTWSNGGSYSWKLTNATGTTPGADWDLLNFSNLSISLAGANDRFTVIITPNALTNFTPGGPNTYIWKIAQATGAGTISGFDPSKFILNTSAITVPNDASFTITDPGGTELDINYTYVPEPSTFSLLTIGALGLLKRRRRR